MTQTNKLLKYLTKLNQLRVMRLYCKWAYFTIHSERNFSTQTYRVLVMGS